MLEQPLMEALKIGLIPVVYGDVVMDIEKDVEFFFRKSN